MDPFTHGLLGGSLAAAGSRSETLRPAAAVGFLAATLADLDTFIQSDLDPLLQLEYHRQFTHSFAFIPLGALIAILLAWPWVKRWLSFRQGYGAALLGYGTAGLLDACTSYGTQLLWPLSDMRLAWNLVPVVEPVTSLVLLCFLLLAVRRSRPAFSQYGLVLFLLWLTLAGWQNGRATELVMAYAQQRGDKVQDVQIKPTMGNLILWRGVYKSQGMVQSVAVRPGVWGEDRLYPGDRTSWFDASKGFPGVDANSVLGRDVVRFADLSGHFLVVHPQHGNVLGDGRYALLPHQISPLWGIVVDPAKPQQHAPFATLRPWDKSTLAVFMAMLVGKELD
ncbi:MAG: metal-dependent hydrolase [Magnetococcales bacterium]|nr:metal-dependent hydrolase [Magnetococcales bacterium]